MNQICRKMMGHGFVVMLIAMLLGIGLLASLLGGMELIPGSIIEIPMPGDSGAWARAHVGGLLNGMLVVLVAISAHLLVMPEKLQKQMAWMLPGTAYANTVFYLAAIVAPNRALTFGDNRFGEASLMGMLGLLPALVFVVVSLVAVFLMAKAAFKA